MCDDQVCELMRLRGKERGKALETVQHSKILKVSDQSATGFPIKDARSQKCKNIPDLLSNDMEGKIVEI